MIKNLQHVGIIMDGNRRWARSQGLAIIKGHSTGMQKVRSIVEAAMKEEIRYLTLFAFSTENWNRAKEEIEGLLNVFREMFDSSDIQQLMRDGVKIQAAGRYSEFPEDIVERIEETQEKSKHNKKIIVTIALGYGGRDEIVTAVQRLIAQNVEKITEEEIQKNLYISDLPDVDLIIRTGGEQRTSGFLLWQAAYAELYFTDVYWPDFNPMEFNKAVEWYYERERRFGK